jgi:Ala-tRNA(Pro) deacylase
VSAHPPEATAQKTAASVHISGKQFAKTVVLRRDGKYLLVVVPANESVDLGHLRSTLGGSVDLASEREFERLFPGCETGAMPPFGGLYGLPVIADECLAERGAIAVNGGTHGDVIELQWEDYVRAEHPQMIGH